MVDVLQDFIEANDVASKSWSDLIKNAIKTSDEEGEFIRAVYARMLGYMYNDNEKIDLIIENKKIVLEQLLKEDKNYNQLLNFCGEELAFIVYFSDDKGNLKKERVNRIFSLLTKHPKFIEGIKETNDKIKVEIESFFKSEKFKEIANKKTDRILKETEDLLGNTNRKSRHVAVAGLLFLRAIENPNSKPALKQQDKPFYGVLVQKDKTAMQKETEQQPAEKKAVSTTPLGPQYSQTQALKGEKLNDFLDYYKNKIFPNESYQNFVINKQNRKYNPLGNIYFARLIQ